MSLIRFSGLLLLLIGFLILSSSAQPEGPIILQDKLTNNLDQFKQIQTGIQPIDQVQEPAFDLTPNRDLTGSYWAQPDGGYYIRQVGNQIYWFGENRGCEIDPQSNDVTCADPSIWANVAYGTINGNTIDVNWADVPKGKSMNSGTAKLIVSNAPPFSNGTLILTVQQQTGGFGTISMHGPF